MDTKLKNNKSASVVAWIFLMLSSLLCCASFALSYAFAEVLVWAELSEDFSDHDYPRFVVNDEAMLNNYVNATGVAALLLLLLSVAILVYILVRTGRGNREPDGSIHMTPCDRIWSELHVALAIGCAVGGGGILAVIIRTLEYQEWFTVVTPLRDEYISNLPDILSLVLLSAALAVLILLMFVSLNSIVKKLKAHKFWEHSLCGKIFLTVYYGIKGSSETMLKVLGVLIAGSLLSATWIGVPIVIILILIFVPRIVNKFVAIKTGVQQVKSGNLSYKIPVETDTRGVKGELDTLADDINNISEAQSVAVANEMKSERMKTELITNVSHDIKTPLTSMITYVDLLKTEGLDGPQAEEYLEIVDEKTQRLKKLTEDLFEAVKASNGAISSDLEPIDMNALVAQALGEMQEKLDERNLQVIVNNGVADECRALADGQLLWRVVENLLINVSKYALEGSRVYVDMSESDRILLEIKNISSEPLNMSSDELMERFKRGDESRNTEGSGLGLSIAKDLTRIMGGEFAVKIDGDLFKAEVILQKADNAEAEA